MNYKFFAGAVEGGSNGIVTGLEAVRSVYEIIAGIEGWGADNHPQSS